MVLPLSSHPNYDHARVDSSKRNRLRPGSEISFGKSASVTDQAPPAKKRLPMIKVAVGALTFSAFGIASRQFILGMKTPVETHKMGLNHADFGSLRSAHKVSNPQKKNLEPRINKRLLLMTFETEPYGEAREYLEYKKNEANAVMDRRFRLDEAVPFTLLEEQPELPIDFKALGHGSSFKDYCQKWHSVERELKQQMTDGAIHADTVVAVVDNRDAWLNLNLDKKYLNENIKAIESFIDKTHQVNADGGMRVIIGAEPEPNLGGLTNTKPWELYDPNNLSRIGRTCNTVKNECPWLWMGDHENGGGQQITGDGQEFIHPWRASMQSAASIIGVNFLDGSRAGTFYPPRLISPNMGLFAGTAANTLNFLKVFDCLDGEDDQVLVSGLAHVRPGFPRLDYYGEVLANNYYLDKCQFHTVDQESGQLFYGHGIKPLITHVPAASKHSGQVQCQYDAFQKLGYPVEKYQARPEYYAQDGVKVPFSEPESKQGQ